MQTELAVQQISCKRDAILLFKNLSFTVRPGELLLIAGANGSGKSSLLRLLASLATPYAGKILWRGQPISSDYAQHLHYVGHANGLKLGLTVQENLALMQILADEDNDTAFDSVLDQLQLTQYKNTYAANLSAGQKRRLALAKLFLFPKPIWLLDEPLTALDSRMQKIFIDHLTHHLHQQGLVVMSSHQIDEFQLLAKQIVRLAPC